jgi:acyl-CoA thioesterase-1
MTGRAKRSVRLWRGAVLTFLLLSWGSAAQAQIVAFGASNISGWNIAARDALPARLQEMLHAKGYGVGVVNAGAAGNTTVDMLNRMDADIPAGTKIVLLDVAGAVHNGLSKGISREQGEANMATIEAKLRARGITIVPVSGETLPAQYHQPDGIHLTAAGAEYLASQLLPQVTQALGPAPQVTQAQSTTQAPSTEVRDACAADARRLCASALGDDAKRHECMHEHRAELSKDCLNAIAKSRQ